MKRSWLYLFLPLAGAVLIGALFAGLGTGVTRALLTAENIALFSLSGAGSVAAALSFSRGDYLRPVWALLALCLTLLCLDAILFGADTASLPRSVSATEGLVSGVLTLIANLASVSALIWVSRAWSVAGLHLQVSRGAYWATLVIAVVIAGAVLGRGLVDGARQVAAGQFAGLPLLASALGDIASAALLVPMLLTALSLRGGSLAWPWGLLAAGTLLWLGFDASSLAAGAFHLSSQTMLPVGEALRAGACFFQLAASLSQRAVVKV